MAALAGVALEDVRQNYDQGAVEGSDQEQWVLCFTEGIERRGYSDRGK